MVFNWFFLGGILHYVIVVCVFVVVWVVTFLLSQGYFFEFGVVVVPSERRWLELVWTIVPSIVVGVLCIWNISCYTNYGYQGPIYPYSVVGHQWYWSYRGFLGAEYDSFVGSFICTVDKPMQLIVGHCYRLLITSEDVIHGFSVPSLGIKSDAIPGRLNATVVFAERYGVFTGYCTELCGAGHGFMPVVIEVVNPRVVKVDPQPPTWLEFIVKTGHAVFEYVVRGACFIWSNVEACLNYLRRICGY